MSSNSLFFLFMMLFAILTQGVFALFEMGCISFSKIRLQYYASLGSKQALQISQLMRRPSRLFGTTLIGISASLQIGSECSRQFYESLHLPPDLSAISQSVLVIIFAELVPIFAARRHPEQVAMGLAPVMYFLSKLFSPIIWAFDYLSHLLQKLAEKPTDSPFFLSLEEVKMAFEEGGAGKEEEFNQTTSRIFQLKSHTVNQLMCPLTSIQMANSQTTLAETRHLLSIHYSSFIPIYHRLQSNIVAVALVRDLVRVEEERKILDFAKSPWFVSENTSVLEILEQFRTNNQNVAIVLDSSGKSCGFLTLDQIIAEIFGAETISTATQDVDDFAFHVERTLLGETLIAAFNHEFDADFSHSEGDTLNDLIVRELDHHPSKGDQVKIGAYVFTVLETSLRGIKVLSVHARK